MVRQLLKMFRIKPQSVANQFQWRNINRPFAALLFLICASLIVPAQSSEQRPNAAWKARVFKPALEMLKKRRVQFDPKLLLDDDWRSRIAPGLATMPEMSASVHGSEQMRGVYFARSLLLPERVTLIGDTFILARELVPSDENSLVNITGNYRLFIFVIGDTKQYQAMRRRPSGDFLSFDVGPCTIIGIRVFHSHTKCQGGTAITGP